MARPRSIFERFTSATIPPTGQQIGFHMVAQSETLMSIANVEYSLQEYDPDLWRGIAAANNIQNPFSFDFDFRGRNIRIPLPPLPDF